jgi:hypothetical protein
MKPTWIILPSSLSLAIDAGIGVVGEANNDALSLSFVLYNENDENCLYLFNFNDDDDDDNDNPLTYPINTINTNKTINNIVNNIYKYINRILLFT